MQQDRGETDLPGWAVRERRRPYLTRERVDLSVQARLRERDAPATLVDLSSGGCRVACAEMVKVGERITITFESGMSVAAEVRWVNDTELGALFEVELSSAEMGLTSASSEDRPASPLEAPKLP